jgi:hypothetical protein
MSIAGCLPFLGKGHGSGNVIFPDCELLELYGSNGGTLI